jgi:hypothetical protein
MQNDLLIEKCRMGLCKKEKKREKTQLKSEEHEDLKLLAYGLFHLNYDVCN